MAVALKTTTSIQSTETLSLGIATSWYSLQYHINYHL